MTNKLILGCDPGQSGCVALLADGVPSGFVDMPTKPRRAGGHEVDAQELAGQLRAHRGRHAGAYVVAVIERVNAMPKQGGSSVFRFGQSDGYLRGVLGALGIELVEVEAQTWKRAWSLWGTEKDVARQLAIRRFPAVAADLARKKDGGRADALLIAAWAHHHDVQAAE